MLDPDFGWHVRLGEIIEKSGFPKTDPFSYTMPSYIFVDHEWLTNVVLAKLYQFVGTKGLAFIFAILATLALFIQVPFPIKKWFFVPFVLVATALFPFVGIRPQLITWFFFSILLFMIFNQKAWRYRHFLPFLFMIWANLHGGFGIGFAALLIVTATRIFEHRRILYKDIVLLFLCAASTLINPYGIRLWWELWMQITDTSLRWNISEWKPAFLVITFTLWVFAAFSIALVLRYKTKFSRSQIVLYIVLLIAGISSVRHMPFWLLLAFPMTIKAMIWFAEEARHYNGGLDRLNKIYKIFAIITVFIVGLEIVINLNGVNSLQEETFYPKQAVEILKDQKSCGQIFSTYSWGGYLIWKLPEKKVFIDGRMASWRRESSSHPESNYAFLEYENLLKGKISIRDTIVKYNIDTFLLPVEKKRNIPFFPEKDEGYGKFIKQLKLNGMIEIYKDNVSVIYGKKYSIQCIKHIQQL